MLTLKWPRRAQADSELEEEPTTAEASSAERGPDVAHPWTNRERLTSMAATGAVWAMCLSGPLALGAQMLGEDSAPSAAVETQAVDASQSVAAFGAGFMTQYLSTPRGQEDRIAGMLADGVDTSLSLPEEPAPPSSVLPAQAVQLTESQWLVTVVVEHPAGGEETGPVRRYWQVPIQSDEAGHRAVSALPSLVPSPTSGELSVQQGSQVSDGAISQALESFMAAYLAGQGDVAPLTAPESSLTAVTPTPYTEVSVGEVSATQEVPASPAEGDLVRTQISVTATAADGSTTQLGYTVELRYRERWEVAAVNPTTEPPTSSEGDPS